jgi:hypothetical protein
VTLDHLVGAGKQRCASQQNWLANDRSGSLATEEPESDRSSTSALPRKRTNGSGVQKIDPAKKRRVSSGGRRVAGEDVVAIFHRLVAREAGVVQRLVAWFAVREIGISPAATRGVLL